MSGIKEIKNHIAGVQDTRKITNAMYLIASTKLRKAKAELDKTRPYFSALRGEVKRIFRGMENVDSPYLKSPGDKSREGRWALLVITADKGLAGAYNHNVLKAAEAFREKHPDARVFVIGEFGRQYFRRNKRDIEPDFDFSAQNPTIERSRVISRRLLSLYDAGELSRIYIAYSDMNGMTAQSRMTQLLPLHTDHFVGKSVDAELNGEFEFYPSPAAVLGSIIQSYVSGFIYSAMVDSYCCELSERMRAMDSATGNADRIIEELSMEYNRQRQGAITQEITEVSAGARAQKKKDAREVQ